MRCLTTCLAGAASILLVACSDRAVTVTVPDVAADTATAPGTELGPCHGDDTCNAGLTCVAGVCVSLPDSGRIDIPQLDMSIPDIALRPDTTHSRGGKNWSLHFDGVDDLVEVSDSQILQFKNKLTIEAWVKADKNQHQGGWLGWSNPRIVCKYLHPSSGYTLNIQVDVPQGVNGSALFEFRDGASGWHSVYGSQNLLDNKWHHVASTYDGVTMKVYIDGILQGQNATNAVIKNNSAPLRFGQTANYPGEDQIFHGNIDEIRLWAYARSQSQLYANMHKHLSCNESDLVGYWKFDEGVGQTASDCTKHSQNGRLGALTSVDSSDPTWTSDVPFP